MVCKFSLIIISWLFMCVPTLAGERQLSENAIIESLLLFAFDNNVSAGQKDVEYFFIQIKDADPSKEILSRFAEYEPKVRPISESLLAEDKSIIHKLTGSRGIVFSVQSIKWVTKEKVVVSWGYYEGSLSASSNEAILEYEEGKWVVREDRLLIISETHPDNQLQPTGFAGGCFEFKPRRTRQIGALIFNEDFKLSSPLKSKIAAASLKADIWHLRCEKDELAALRRELAERLKSNSESSSLSLVQEEVEEICRKYT